MPLLNIPTQDATRRRRLAAMVAALAIGLVAFGSAAAGEGRGRAMRAPAFRGAQFQNRAAQRERMQRVAPAREQVAPQPQAPQGVPSAEVRVDRVQRPGRMTPEERRALRQQINDAGRDIYRAPRP